MMKSKHLSLKKPIKFLVVSVLLSLGVFTFAWYRNITAKTTQESQQVIVSWLDSFKSQDFKTCDLLPQNRNYRLDGSIFNEDSSAIIYEETLKFLAQSVKVDGVKSLSKNEFEVTMQVPICSLDNVDYKNISSETSTKLGGSVEGYVSKQYSLSDFNDKNREILLNSLILVLDKSKTEEYKTVKQVFYVGSDGTVRNTRNLVYKITVTSKVNDILQSYISNLDVFLNYEAIK